MRGWDRTKPVAVFYFARGKPPAPIELVAYLPRRIGGW